MSLAWRYWCRYHGRYESTEDNDPCRTAEDCAAEHERVFSERKSDPPSLGTRFRQFFGLKVNP